MPCNFGLPNPGDHADFIHCSDSNPYEQNSDCWNMWQNKCGWQHGYNGDPTGGGWVQPEEEDPTGNDDDLAFDETEEFLDEWGEDPMEDCNGPGCPGYEPGDWYSDSSPGSGPPGNFTPVLIAGAVAYLLGMF